MLALQPAMGAETDAQQQAAGAPDTVTTERIFGESSQPKAAAAPGGAAAQQQGLGSSAHGPLSAYLHQQQQWHQHAKSVELSAKSCLAKSPGSLAETYVTEKRPLADMGLWAGADIAGKQSTAADRHAHSAGTNTSVSRSAVQQHQCLPISRDIKPQSHMLLARPSTLKSPLCTPGSLSGLSPLQHFAIPKLKTPSAALVDNCTPTLASKQSAAQEWTVKLKPCRDSSGGQSSKRQASAKGHPSNAPSNVTPRRGFAGAHSAEPQASAKRKPSDAPSSVPIVVDLCTPAAVTIPCLKPATAAGLGQSPLAFPGFSPAAAQTFHSNMLAVSMSAVTELVPRHATSMQQQECGTPLLPCRPAGLAQVIARSAVHTGAEHTSGFGSPLLIQDTPQVTIRRGADSCPAGAAPEAAAEVDGPSSAASAPHGTAPIEACAPPDTFAKARTEPAQQQPEHQPANSFISDSQQQPRAMVKRKAQRRGRKRTQSSAEQQENTEAGQVQQAGPADGRAPLIAMAGAALNQADSSETSSRGRKREKGDAGGRASYGQGGGVSQQATASTGCAAESIPHGPIRSAPRVLGLSSGREPSSVPCSA